MGRTSIDSDRRRTPSSSGCRLLSLRSDSQQRLNREICFQRIQIGDYIFFRSFSFLFIFDLKSMVFFKLNYIFNSCGFLFFCTFQINSLFDLIINLNLRDKILFLSLLTPFKIWEGVYYRIHILFILFRDGISKYSFSDPNNENL